MTRLYRRYIWVLDPDPLYGQKLHAARLSKGWSQKQLAERAQCSQGLLCHYEKGHMHPTKAQEQKIDAALELKVRQQTDLLASDRDHRVTVSDAEILRRWHLIDRMNRKRTTSEDREEIRRTSAGKIRRWTRAKWWLLAHDRGLLPPRHTEQRISEAT